MKDKTIKVNFQSAEIPRILKKLKKKLQAVRHKKDICRGHKTGGMQPRSTIHRTESYENGSRYGKKNRRFIRATNRNRWKTEEEEKTNIEGYRNSLKFIIAKING